MSTSNKKSADLVMNTSDIITRLKSFVSKRSWKDRFKGEWTVGNLIEKILMQIASVGIVVFLTLPILLEMIR